MTISIEVVYALPDQQVVIPIECCLPVTIGQAIQQSGILLQFPEIVLEDDSVGVFGLRQPLDYQLEPDDRVEIYRSLYLSPTQARKMRAESRRRRQNKK